MKFLPVGAAVAISSLRLVPIRTAKRNAMLSYTPTVCAVQSLSELHTFYSTVYVNSS